MMMTTCLSNRIVLRPYQMLAHEAITKGFHEYRKQIAVMPTGGGKTLVFAALAQHYQPARTLVLAHREELIFQAVDKIEKATGLMAEVEMADSKASFHAPVVVGSIQTLTREQRRNRWPRDHFGLVVVDECHRVLGESYLSTLRHFDSFARVLGVTATPDRGDRKNLGQYFENIAYEVGLLDLIRQNWLAPIKVKTVPLQIDLDGCRTTAGDYNAEDVGHALEPYLERIASVLDEHRHRKILVFLPLISISKDLARICRLRGIAAEHIDGQSKDRTVILDRFRRGKTTLLTNAMLLAEGYDEPSIDCIVCLRPTQVRSLYSQIVGRGTRIYPGKDHLLLLDFLWLAEEHNLIKPAHLVAGDEEEAMAITDALAGDGDLEEAKATAEEDRATKLRERLRQNQNRIARTFDAMEFALSLKDVDLAEFTPTMRWHEHDVSDKQRAIIARFGLDPDSVQNKGHASALLDRLFLRSNLHLATAKQLRWLYQIGHPHPETLTCKEASAYLSEWANRKVHAI
ncbi:MAG: DEAD/DEAH box helicase [Chthoniobacteraceae bacterium]